MLDLEAIDFLGPVPAELFEGFQYWEAGGFDAQLDGVLEPLLVLAVNEAAEVVDVTAVLLNGLLGQGGVSGLKERQPQIIELLMQQRGLGVHHGLEGGAFSYCCRLVGGTGSPPFW